MRGSEEARTSRANRTLGSAGHSLDADVGVTGADDQVDVVRVTSHGSGGRRHVFSETAAGNILRSCCAADVSGRG